MNVEIIKNKNKICAIIIHRRFLKKINTGVNFLTASHLPMQLGYLKHKKNKIIEAHFHKKLPRKINFSSEVLIMKKGILRVEFYNMKKEIFAKKILKTGDIALLLEGAGHGFFCLKNCEIIEVKQGPYFEKKDKIRF
jgi:hypothetical protein